jgi:hypothetical protein
MEMVGVFIFDEVERVDCTVREADPPSLEVSELFEAHYQSKTHRRCVNVFLLLPHNRELRQEVSKWLNLSIKELPPAPQCDEIVALLSQYTRSGYSVVFTQFLCKALLMLQTCMKAELRVLLVKKLAIESAKIFGEEKSDVLLPSHTEFKGGLVSLTASLVLKFRPEFTEPSFEIPTASTILERELGICLPARLVMLLRFKSIVSGKCVLY